MKSKKSLDLLPCPQHFANNEPTLLIKNDTFPEYRKNKSQIIPVYLTLPIRTDAMKVIISLSEIPGLVCIAQIGCFVHLDVGWIKGFRFTKQDRLRCRFIGVLSVVLCA